MVPGGLNPKREAEAMASKYGVCRPAAPNWNALPRMADGARREWAVVDLDTFEELTDRFLTRGEALTALEALLRELAELTEGSLVAVD